MIYTVLLVASLITAIASGLVAGVFFAFSTTVMRSLRVIPTRFGITVMQTINVKILNPRFAGVFFAGTAAALLLVAIAPFATGQPYVLVRALGGLLYLVCVVGVTFLVNVPLNNALDEVDPVSQEGARYWDHFLDRWMAWHYVRTIAASVVAAGVTIALAL